MYHVTTYYISKVITELPLNILAAIVFTLIVFFGIGLTITFISFLKFLFVMMLIGFASSAYGYFLSILFSRPENAVQLSPMLMMPLSIIGGFMTNVGSVPAWIAWLQYISPVRYGFEAFV